MDRVLALMQSRGKLLTRRPGRHRGGVGGGAFTGNRTPQYNAALCSTSSLPAVRRRCRSQSYVADLFAPTWMLCLLLRGGSARS